MSKSTMSRDQKLSLYEKMVASHPDAIRKGNTIPITSVNGHMYSFLTKQDVVALRLPVYEIEKFLEKYKTSLVEQYGIVQKEYVVVPDSLLVKTKELIPYFNLSNKYVFGLKTKPKQKPERRNKIN